MNASSLKNPFLEVNAPLYAHLYRRRGGGYELFIGRTIRHVDADRVIYVSGKREARAIAAKHNATAWNF
jgi:hypothetical protein